MFRKVAHLIRAAAAIAFLLVSVAAAQTATFSAEGVKYQLDLPSARWRPVPRLDVHDHFEFVYGEARADGYLRVREYLAETGATAEDLYRREQTRSLRSLPNYVECAPSTGERFEGALSAAVFDYEYTEGGRPMAGRVYYLRTGGRSFYSLHFTGEARKIRELRGELDSIARSFRLR